MTRQTLRVTDVIDASPLSALQVRVLLLCFLVVLLDGFDMAVIGYVAPELLRDWNIERGQLVPVFAAGLFGMLLGNLVLGPLADRHGRKRVLLLSLAIIAIGTLACAFAGSPTWLAMLRFLTGIGIGGVLPNSITLCSEYSPARRRTLLVMLSNSGFTLGLAMGGWLSAALLPSIGWQGLLLLGGLAPLLLLPVLALGLPESISFMADRAAYADRLRAVLGQIGGRRAWHAVRLVGDGATRGASSPASILFRDGHGLRTLMLWLSFFCCLLVFYLLANWLPTLLHEHGYERAQIANIAAMVPFGGVLGGVSMALLIDRMGAAKVLPPLCLLAAVALALAGAALEQGRALPAMALVFLVGFTLTGTLNNLGILAATLYPSQARATGVSWALGAGRVGSIIGSLSGAWLLAAAGGLQALFQCIALPVLCSALALLLMGGRRPLSPLPW
ncbi:TPA: MFS transporter [Pseudomonas aeruginosa]|uniref:MFS transporter n=1 Tax=Pseudomonas aeruginosa TaxID=287 RepID=UPI000FC43ADA|nr:MFS transporter [Pseudomonas aeruginosa]MBV5800376.1 MFS transporter [Pseudomonas aeruginosa]MCV3851388.1 MFS transporter [Pseudomonas aeruginosa]MCV3857420.1 MFS transporter [Pseudomonas aeruginosa]MDU0746196.1 MFS transporter [Pseudomonas aeruginosa]MDU0758441.1 MFS transporter [Pseudomonas aeruginosa]